MRLNTVVLKAKLKASGKPLDGTLNGGKRCNLKPESLTGFNKQPLEVEKATVITKGDCKAPFQQGVWGHVRQEKN